MHLHHDHRSRELQPRRDTPRRTPPCGRAMTHHLEDEVVGENRVSYDEACEYPDGVKVLGAATIELRDGMVT